MIEIREPLDGVELAAAIELRRSVFVEEQGVPLEEEDDGRDADAVHLVVVEDGTVVGTCRLLPSGDAVKLERMAVVARARGRGLATALLVAAERRALELGATRIALAAQAPVVGLYARAGYATRGAPFLEAGIEHLAMDKALRASAA